MIKRRLKQAWLAFRLDRRGVSAIEFAIIAPVVIIAYFGMSELSLALMSQRRVSHASSALGDLTSQFKTLQMSDVNNIFAASSLIMQPFSTTTLQLRLTSITLQSNGKATVDWSEAQGTGLTKYPIGTVITDPTVTSLLTQSSSIILSEAKYTFTSPVQYALPASLPFSETFYLTPRYGSTITCSTCT